MSLNKDDVEREMIQIMLDCHTKDDTPYTKGIDLGIFFYYWTELNGGPFRDELWDLFWREDIWSGFDTFHLVVDDIVPKVTGMTGEEMVCKLWNEEPFKNKNTYHGYNDFKKTEPKNWDEFWKEYSRTRWCKDVISIQPDGNVLKIK